MTSGSYDPGVWTGNTWSADDRSTDWRTRSVDDYGVHNVGYTELGWPDRYDTTLYGVGYRGLGPQNWRRSDTRIRDDVCELMTDDEALDPSEIEVQVQEGEVTLTGSVESRQDKRHAERLADQVLGVRDVHNRLQVLEARDTFPGTDEPSTGDSTEDAGGTTRQ